MEKDVILHTALIEQFLPLIVALGVISFLFIAYSIYFMFVSKDVISNIGMEEMVGMEAKVLEELEDGYLVYCHSERWKAKSKESLQKNEVTKVVAVDGLVLELRKKEK